jgi:integrase
MTIDRTPTVRVYVRERGGKRNFYPAPRNPDLAACYWLRYENDGKQSWQRVGHYDLVAREKLLLERRLSAQAQGFILPEDHTVAKNADSRVTIRAAVDAYLESLRIKNRPKKTISGKTYELGLFAGSCKKSYMDELVSADMLGFRDYLRAEDYAERTIYNYLMTTTTFLKKNPAYKIVGLLEAEDWPEIPRTDPEPYVEEEVRALLAVSNEFQRLVIRFFVGTGCREQEVAHVEWHDINWVTKTVWIHAKPQYGWKPKTAAGTRKIPLSDSLLTDLKALQATSTNALVFPAKMGSVEGHFLRMFKELGTLAGVSNVKCHRFRDTYITDKVREGVDLPTIRKWVGHEDLETLALYAQALRHDDERARAAANSQERYTLRPQLVKTA